MASTTEFSSDWYRKVLDNLNTVVFVADKEGRSLYLNLASQKSYGPAETILGEKVADLIQAGKWQGSAVLKVLETGEPASAIVKTSIGTELIALSTPVFDENGNLELIVSENAASVLLEYMQGVLSQAKRDAERYKSEIEYLRNQRETAMIAAAPIMQTLRHKAGVIAKTDSPILLCGETGSGKDVFAEFIYKNSSRANKAFIDINCAALPDNLLEAELFGYEKGAFSGAAPAGKPGLFEIANEGTLFLDEVGELPLSCQAKLLRVLENNSYRRIGGTKTLKTDVRLICATNRDLKKMSEEGTFRSDLYYRINVLELNIPPLRERREDIVPLATKFLDYMNTRYATCKALSPESKIALTAYNWPGNIRELRNIISRAFILTDGPTLDTQHLMLSEEITASIDNIAVPKTFDYPDSLSLKEFRKLAEAAYIQRMLHKTGGNVDEAAARLGLHRSNLYRHLNDIKKHEHSINLD